MTVREIRDAIAQIPDDAEVFVSLLYDDKGGRQMWHTSTIDALSYDGSIVCEITCVGTP